MNTKRPESPRPEEYWARAGEVGYGKAMYCSTDVERHVRGRLWNAAVEIADAIGIGRSGRVLDLGCGDGAFANEVLSRHYAAVEGYDGAASAIQRAKSMAVGSHLRFEMADITTLDFGSQLHYEGAFLLGILHHVKAATPSIVRRLRTRTRRVVVLEPNGSNVMRKVLEWTPSYRAAGEDSFSTNELVGIFDHAGYRLVVCRRMNLFPNFTPSFVYRVLVPLEPCVERSRFFNVLCTVNMFGFTAVDC